MSGWDQTLFKASSFRYRSTMQSRSIQSDWCLGPGEPACCKYVELGWAILHMPYLFKYWAEKWGVVVTHELKFTTQVDPNMGQARVSLTLAWSIVNIPKPSLCFPILVYCWSHLSLSHAQRKKPSCHKPLGSAWLGCLKIWLFFFMIQVQACPCWKVWPVVTTCGSHAVWVIAIHLCYV